MTPPARGSLIACRDLFQIYRLAGHEVVALQGVDLDVGRGELLALLGPSGAGKSTLLGLVGGLERPAAGRVWVDGQDLARLPEAALTVFRRGRVGFVFQTPARNLLPYASAAQNLELPMRLAGVPAGRRGARARALLAATGLLASGGRSVRPGWCSCRPTPWRCCPPEPERWWRSGTGPSSCTRSSHPTGPRPDHGAARRVSPGNLRGIG